MRLRIAVSLLALALACSTKLSGPDAQGQDTRMDMGADTSMDMGADTSMDTKVETFGGACPNGYPCCIFTEPPAAGSAQCMNAACIIPDAGTGAPHDADSFGCPGCPDGYACAIWCPSPNGGCGPPSMCCPVQ